MSKGSRQNGSVTSGEGLALRIDAFGLVVDIVCRPFGFGLRFRFETVLIVTVNDGNY